MLKTYKTPGNCNRAYVIDSKGNKIYYGTLYQCDKFKKYMKGELDNERKSEISNITGRKDRD